MGRRTSNLIMPKNDGTFSSFRQTMETLKNKGGILKTEDFKDALGEVFAGLDVTSLYHKTEMPRYFGMMSFNSSTKVFFLTELGSKLLKVANSTDIIKVFFESLKSVRFGKYNNAFSTDSNIEAPVVFLKSILIKNGISKNQIGCVLFYMDREELSLEESLKKTGNDDNAKSLRGKIENLEGGNKYFDIKFIVLFEDLGIINNDNGTYKLSDYVYREYETLIKSLPEIYFDNLEDKDDTKKKIHSNPRNGGDNVIYYGAPGCGKSHQVKKDLSSVPEENKYRVTFHPEYTNSDFVGQILPRIESDVEGREIVKYVFNPGPFTKALERALTTEDPVFLVIEEINRGNAAAIFGDLFQLLDRQQALDENGNGNPDFGKSEYEITNPNIEDYLKGQIELPDNFKIYIPRNMRIRATMNSSDQNVFTLDTAFKRRWDFEQISNEFNDEDIKRFEGLYIPGTEVEWKDFLEKINPEILKYKIRNSTNEDKQLGKYFINEACLTKGFIKIENCQNEANRFAYKVLEYLWNDVCKIDKDDWFDTAKYQTLEKLIDGFMKPGNNQNPLSVFKGIDFSKK